jgi:hypothetical protein
MTPQAYQHHAPPPPFVQTFSSESQVYRTWFYLNEKGGRISHREDGPYIEPLPGESSGLGPFVYALNGKGMNRRHYEDTISTGSFFSISHLATSPPTAHEF